VLQSADAPDPRTADRPRSMAFGFDDDPLREDVTWNALLKHNLPTSRTT